MVPMRMSAIIGGEIEIEVVCQTTNLRSDHLSLALDLSSAGDLVTVSIGKPFLPAKFFFYIRLNSLSMCANLSNLSF
jgi:hypothetical protein